VTGKVLAGDAVHGLGSTLPAPAAEPLVDSQPLVPLAQRLTAVVADDVDLHDLIALRELAAVHLAAVPTLPAIRHPNPPRALLAQRLSDDVVQLFPDALDLPLHGRVGERSLDGQRGLGSARLGPDVAVVQLLTGHD
jgi:hypothetical protein